MAGAFQGILRNRKKTRSMKIQLDTLGHENTIQAYRPGQVTINQTVYSASVILTPERIIADWPPMRFADLAPAHFQTIAALAPEIVILGTGKQLRFPPAKTTRSLIQANIGLEVMDTGAACRTYNILMAEGRRVAAALLMIEDE